MSREAHLVFLFYRHKSCMHPLFSHQLLVNGYKPCLLVGIAMKCVILGFCISSCLIAIALAIPLIEAEDDLKPKRFLSRISPKPDLPHDMWITPNQMEVNKIYHLSMSSE